jgi:hypothetical protein
VAFTFPTLAVPYDAHRRCAHREATPLSCSRSMRARRERGASRREAGCPVPIGLGGPPPSRWGPLAANESPRGPRTVCVDAKDHALRSRKRLIVRKRPWVEESSHAPASRSRIHRGHFTQIRALEGGGWRLCQHTTPSRQSFCDRLGIDRFSLRFAFSSLARAVNRSFSAAHAAMRASRSGSKVHTRQFTQINPPRKDTKNIILKL